MSDAILTIDLDALVGNWRQLDALSAASVETAAVVKADGYGLGAGEVGKALSKAGAKTFFVATAGEGIILRKAIGIDASIFIFSGHMDGASERLKSANLIPLLNDPSQVQRHLSTMPDHPYGVQLDSGMNRLGCEPDEFATLKSSVSDAKLIISHLACADEPTHGQNQQQLAAFKSMTDGLEARRSLAATGGTLLGGDFHFDLCRPGIGLYGAMPFANGQPVVTLTLPIIQTRLVKTGESVGYGANWVAPRDTKVATLSAGYADGLIRAMGNGTVGLYANGQRCPLIGRVSMDLLTVDVTDLGEDMSGLDILCNEQSVDDLADAAGTIGYEILTSLGARYERRYKHS